MTSENFQINVELAGMVDLDGLLLAKGLPTEDSRIPLGLKLDGDDLTYHGREAGEGKIAGVVGALDNFVRLRDRKDVLGFAKRYGVLGMYAHYKALRAMPRSQAAANIALAGAETEGTDEPIEGWLGLADEAKAILSIASALHRDEETSSRDWHTVFHYYIERGLLSGGATVQLSKAEPAVQRRSLAGALRAWLDLAAMRLRLSWDEREPTFELTGDLFAILSVQLVSAVARAPSIFICSGCGNLYTKRDRRPKKGHRNFCPDCRASGVPARINSQAQRDKKAKRKREGK